MAKPGKRQKGLGTFGSSKGGVFLKDDLRKSLAYRSLSLAEQWVLADFISKYNRKSSGDRTDLRGIGFTFTMRDILVDVTPKTFYKARSRICEVGFFKRDDSLKAVRVHAPDIFIPSRDWVSFVPDKEAQKRIDKNTVRTRDYLRRNKERRRKYIQRREDSKDD
jgi:hypothetical protein